MAPSLYPDRCISVMFRHGFNPFLARSRETTTTYSHGIQILWAPDFYLKIEEKRKQNIYLFIKLSFQPLLE